MDVPQTFGRADESPGPDDVALPQPFLRVLGVLSIGLGTGLTAADAPLAVLVLAFVPGLLALAIVAVRSSIGDPVSEPVDLPAERVISRQEMTNDG